MLVPIFVYLDLLFCYVVLVSGVSKKAVVWFVFKITNVRSRRLGSVFVISDTGRVVAIELVCWRCTYRDC